MARPQSNGHSYELCFARRSLQTRYLPGFFVFPGGRYEAVDTSIEICAMRETYEESGVFLPTAFRGSKVLRNRWIPQRETVSKNPSMYIDTLKRLKCLNSLDSLNEFGTFLTPDFMVQKYKTAYVMDFFVACISTAASLEASPDGSEVTELVWLTPRDALLTLALPPPQVYILDILQKCDNIDELPTFAKQMMKTYLRYPIKAHFLDDRVYVLPGDHQHPQTIVQGGFLHRGIFGENKIQRSAELMGMIVRGEDWCKDVSKL